MESPPSHPSSSAKLRLMCSYGGRIIPRPQTKNLFYAGGDTRIVTVPATGTLSLSSLGAHLASALHLSYPFHLKYQLPNHDLDALISLSTDDDLLIMLDEYRLLSPGGPPCRIRLFVFPLGTEGNPELKHPKRESFFVDALNGVVGYNGGEDGGSGGPESIVLETSSSFGSTSSTVSLSNLPVKAPAEDGNLVDKKAKLGSSETGSGDAGVAASVYCPLTGNYQDQAGGFAVVENSKPSTNPFESESKVVDPSHGGEVHRAIQVSGIPMSYQPQQVQYVPMSYQPLSYQPHNQVGIAPASSYYPVGSVVSQQQQLYYQTNQPQAVYYVPVGQAYNMPVQGGLVNTGMMPQSHAPVHPKTAVNVTRVAYNVPAASPMTELTTQVYRTVPMTTSLVDGPPQENHEQGVGVSQVSNQALATGAAQLETGNTGFVHLDDLARMQIYKSQPPPPSLPSQYQTKANATPHLLSEAFEQLHMDNTKQQLRAAQPQ